MSRTREEAERIVHAAVESRVTAGAQISGPIVSTYWWKGEIQRSEEFLILMKTAADRLDDFIVVVREAKVHIDLTHVGGGIVVAWESRMDGQAHGRGVEETATEE